MSSCATYGGGKGAHPDHRSASGRSLKAQHDSVQKMLNQIRAWGSQLPSQSNRQGQQKVSSQAFYHPICVT